MSYRNVVGIVSFPVAPLPPLPMRPPLFSTLPPPPTVFSFLHKTVFPLSPYLFMFLHVFFQINIPLPLIVGGFVAYRVYQRYLRFQPPEEHLRNFGRWLLGWTLWSLLLFPVLVPLGFYEILLTEDVVQKPFLRNAIKFLWGFFKGAVGIAPFRIPGPAPGPNAAAAAAAPAGDAVAAVPARGQGQNAGQVIDSPVREELKAWRNIFEPLIPFLAFYVVLRILFAYFGLDGNGAGGGAARSKFTITSDSEFSTVGAELEKIMREAESFSDIRYIRPRFHVFANGTRR
jgi:hypothetical protein